MYVQIDFGDAKHEDEPPIDSDEEPFVSEQAPDDDEEEDGTASFAEERMS